MTEIDFAVLNWIQAHFQSTFADNFWRIVTTIGNGGFFWIAVCVVLILFKKTRKMGLVMLITLGCCYITYDFVLKNLIGRLRPYQQNPEFQILIKEPHGSSFPSGHSASGMCMATLFFFFRKENKFTKIVWIPALVLAALIAISRLYLYVHFPSDVIAGTLIGIGFGTAGYFISRKIAAKKA